MLDKLQNINLLRLDEAVSAVAPIEAVAYRDDQYAIDYKPEATAQEIANGDAVLASFDFSLEAAEEWLENKNPERKNLREAAAKAIADLDLFLGLADPTNAQIKLVVQKMALHQKRIIRRLIQID